MPVCVRGGDVTSVRRLPRTKSLRQCVIFRQGYKTRDHTLRPVARNAARRRGGARKKNQRKQEAVGSPTSGIGGLDERRDTVQWEMSAVLTARCDSQRTGQQSSRGRRRRSRVRSLPPRDCERRQVTQASSAASTAAAVATASLRTQGCAGGTGFEAAGLVRRSEPLTRTIQRRRSARAEPHRHGRRGQRNPRHSHTHHHEHRRPSPALQAHRIPASGALLPLLAGLPRRRRRSRHAGRVRRPMAAAVLLLATTESSRRRREMMPLPASLPPGEHRQVAGASPAAAPSVGARRKRSRHVSPTRGLAAAAPNSCSVSMDPDVHAAEAVMEDTEFLPSCWGHRLRGQELIDHYIKETARLSEKTRVRLGAQKDIRFGKHPRECLDLYYGDRQPDECRSTLLFWHGGYWVEGDRQSHALVADAFVEAGMVVAVAGYPLAPGATLDQIVESATRCARHVLALRPGPLVLAGHSAGAHLAAMVATRLHGESRLRSLLLLSPVLDVVALLGSSVARDAAISADQAMRNSPLQLVDELPTHLHIVVTYSEHDPPWFGRTAGAYREALGRRRISCELLEYADEDHFSFLLGPLRDAAHRVTARIVQAALAVPFPQQ